MKLSHTSEYALRILSFMAKEPERLFSARYLVEHLNISDKYLRRMMTNLTKAGFIKSTQGRGGGYTFARNPGQIALADIIDSFEGLGHYLGCVLGFVQCSDTNPCVLHAGWIHVRQQFESTFKNTTLADLNFDQVKKY